MSPTLSDFSSLLQLGIGLGIGLSVFRAPVDLRIGRISRTLHNERIAHSASKNAVAMEKFADLADLTLDFHRIQKSLERAVAPFMGFAVGGAFVNVLALIAASLYPACEVRATVAAVLIFISVVYFVIIFAVLEIIARMKTKDVDRRISEIQQYK